MTEQQIRDAAAKRGEQQGRNAPPQQANASDPQGYVTREGDRG